MATEIAICEMIVDVEKRGDGGSYVFLLKRPVKRGKRNDDETPEDQMRVTDIETYYERHQKVADYSHVKVTTKVSAVVDDGDDPQETALDAMRIARETVRAGMTGGDAPAPSPKQTVTTTVEKAKPAEPSDVPDDDTVPDGDAKPAKRRGRPPGSKNKAAPKPSSDDTMPGDDDGDPGADDGGSEEPAEEITVQALHGMFVDAVKTPNIAPADVKAILAKYGAAVTKDVKPEDRAKAAADVRDLVARVKVVG